MTFFQTYVVRENLKTYLLLFYIYSYIKVFNYKISSILCISYRNLFVQLMLKQTIFSLTLNAICVLLMSWHILFYSIFKLVFLITNSSSSRSASYMTSTSTSSLWRTRCSSCVTTDRPTCPSTLSTGFWRNFSSTILIIKSSAIKYLKSVLILLAFQTFFQLCNTFSLRYEIMLKQI